MVPSHLLLRRLGCVRPASAAASQRRHGAPSRSQVDLAVVGGGIVGAAAALQIKKRFPTLQVVILEKEATLAAHQSGHNSGVVHAGIYYTPGSLKAQLCVRGLRMTYDFCDQHNVPYRKIGKLIVALDGTEMAGLRQLHERGQRNGVPGLELLDANGLRHIAPHCTGVAALWSPQTGIVDWSAVTREYGRQFERLGGRLRLGTEVTGFEQLTEPSRPLLLRCGTQRPERARFVITCGGLHADRLAALSGCGPEPRLVPVRGEYLLLRPEKAHLVPTNIYPVPAAGLPFLGVHFTPRLNGEVWLGPNAVLAGQREGYRWSDICLPDIIEQIRYGGFRRLAARHARFGAGEVARSLFTRLQVARLRRYVPELCAADIVRGPAGVRAQAVAPDGTLVDDFVLESAPAAGAGGRMLHVRNAPSPAATSSLAIGELIADRAQAQFALS